MAASRLEQPAGDPPDLVERLAPILVMWPEIPVSSAAEGSARDAYMRQRRRSASDLVSGAHISRDYHPRSVRLILDHAQVWEPRAPLPFVPAAFALAYREYAKLFFVPLMLLMVFPLILVSFAQLLDPPFVTAIEVGAIVFVALIYLLTIRSPILIPTDNWHHANHIVVGITLVATWVVAFGTWGILIFGPLIAIPTLLAVLSGLAIRFTSSLWSLALLFLKLLRRLVAFVSGRQLPTRKDWLVAYSLFRGAKAAHEYSESAELFFRDPHTREAIHRTDRESHWKAYSKIISDRDYPVVYYARVLGPDLEGVTIVQYWLCYYYDDWANQHEGDWETVSILLREGQPVGVACSQHEAGEYREWSQVERRGERPVLYVAAGSHAMYFEPGARFTERKVGGFTVTSLDAAIIGADVLDYLDITPSRTDQASVIDNSEVRLIPDPDPNTGLWGHLSHADNCRGDCEQNYEWLNFHGHWGVSAFAKSGASGPYGPAYSGLRWDNPRMWSESLRNPS